MKHLTQRVVDFRNRRKWKKFHNPKDSAISLVLEANEVLEYFLWKNREEVRRYVIDHKDDIADELSDVLANVLLMAHDLGIDLPSAFESKMVKNEAKYPVAKCRGNNKKYTEF